MLKDKPVSYTSLLPQGRQRRSWLIVAAIVLLYIITSPFVHRTQSAHPLFPTPIDWHRYAYSQYATDQHYLCNSLMIFHQLESLGSKADRLLFYPQTWDTTVSSSTDRTSQLLVMARDKYHVKLQPVEMYTLKRQTPDDVESWDASINKLHAWNQGEYDRVIHLDSDITLLQSLDELFFLPLSKGSPVAMARAYWQINDANTPENDQHQLTSLLIVLTPSAAEAQTLWDMAAGLDNDTVSTSLFDMNLLNARYGSSSVVLPHRPYALVSGEFRRAVHNHSMYLGNSHERWDPHAALREAKLVHFSDWPLPKPHVMWPNNLMVEMQPACEIEPGTPREQGCDDRAVWKGLYDDFRRRRKDVCRLLSVLSPEWPPRNKKGKKTPAKGAGMVGITGDGNGAENEAEEVK